MKIGEKIVVERLASGLYAIRLEQGMVMVGGAASTAISLMHEVFITEAHEIPKNEADAA